MVAIFALKVNSRTIPHTLCFYPRLRSLPSPWARDLQRILQTMYPLFFSFNHQAILAEPTKTTSPFGDIDFVSQHSSPLPQIGRRRSFLPYRFPLLIWAPIRNPSPPFEDQTKVGSAWVAASYISIVEGFTPARCLFLRFVFPPSPPGLLKISPLSF